MKAETMAEWMEGKKVEESVDSKDVLKVVRMVSWKVVLSAVSMVRTMETMKAVSTAALSVVKTAALRADYLAFRKAGATAATTAALLVVLSANLRECH